MGNFLTDFVKHDPTPINDIRDSLNRALSENIDLITLMKEHHDYLGESISILMDVEASPEEKKAHLFRFFRLIEMHGKAEEEVLYVQLRNNTEAEARMEGYGGQDQHDIVFQLEEELLEMGYQTSWSEEISAKARVVAYLMKNHIKEEESVMFPLVEKYIAGHILDEMCLSYIAKCQAYLDESRMTSISHPVVRLRPNMEFTNERSF